MQNLQHIEPSDPAARAQPVPERVVVINDISVLKGGATSVALASAAGLLQRGIPVTFITGDDASETAADHDAVDFVAVGGQHILQRSRANAALNGLYNREAAALIAAWIARHDTPRTVYHLHGWSKILSPSVFRALRPVADRLAVHAHDYFLVCPNGGFFDFQKGEVCDRRPLSFSCLGCQCDKRNYLQKLWRSVRQELRYLMLDLSKKGLVLPVHEGMVPFLEKGGLSPEHIKVLRNPVEAWRTERVKAEDNRRFLFVGRLDEDKGALALARAARRAGITLSMAGVGPLSETLARDFPEIELLGWQQPQQLTALSNEVRAVVMPSLWRETFGLVAFEAMLSGIPVVVSDRMMIAEEVASNGLGLAGDPEDEAAFAALLDRMAKDDALVAGFSRRAYETAAQLAPDADLWIEQLIGVYGDLLAAAMEKENAVAGRV